MNLSKRMEAVVSLVSPQSCFIADIGCDHAYVSIALVERELAKKVIAMDVRKGPLEIAARNVNRAGLHNVIELRLSDGLEQLKCNEVDTIIIAGMGGLLIRDILQRGGSVLDGSDQCSPPALILQPQSDIEKVREFLLLHQYSIVKEEVLEEDGKYYTVLRAEGKESVEADSMSYDKWKMYHEEDYLYGHYNLFHRNEALKQYLLKEKQLLNQINLELMAARQRLEQEKKPMPKRTKDRLQEIGKELIYNEKALAWYKEVQQ